jgi:predicted small lipoprotein YifL
MRLFLLATTLLLGACGQTGDLYLPDANPPIAGASAADRAAEEEKQEEEEGRK